MHTIDTCRRKVVTTGSVPYFIHFFMPIITIHLYIQAYTNNLYFETSVVIKYNIILNTLPEAGSSTLADLL